MKELSKIELDSFFEQNKDYIFKQLVTAKPNQHFSLKYFWYQQHRNEIFNLIEQAIDEILERNLQSGEFFQDFVDVKNLSLGESARWF